MDASESADPVNSAAADNARDADVGAIVEAALEAAVGRIATADAPPKLADAVRHSVFPSGARLRPRLCVAVALASGGDARLAAEAAAAVEFMHCGSLVHDDLPCFDDAGTRRGQPSVHAKFGEALAVLAGDALIVLAYSTVARAFASEPQRLPGLIETLSGCTGMPHGIIAGQGWESEPNPHLEAYHRAKTGSLFVAATVLGAQAAGADPSQWHTLGAKIGAAYQVADDLRDFAGSEEDLGKPTGRDADLGRPNAVNQRGLDESIARLKTLVAEAMASIPDGPGAAALRELIKKEAQRFLPKELAQRAA